MHTLTTLLPIFLIIALGYATVRTNLLSHDASNSLAKLIFYIIIPPTLFIDLARLPIQTLLAWPYIGAYLAASSCLAFFTAVLSYKFFHRRARLIRKTPT